MTDHHEGDSLSKPKPSRIETCSCCGRDTTTTRAAGTVILCGTCNRHGGGFRDKDVRAAHMQAEWDSMTVDGEGAARFGTTDDYWEIRDADD